MKICWILSAAAVAAVLAAAPPASAQVLTFELLDSAGNALTGNTVTVAPGGSFKYSAYLLADASAQALLNSHSGLISSFTKVTQGTPALITSTAAVAAVPAPWQQGNVANGATPSISDSTFGSGLEPAAVGSGGALGILLGTFTFNAGSTPGTDVLTIGLKDVSGGDNVAFDGTPFDSMSHSSTTSFVISPVPEPGTLVLVGMAAAGLGAWRRRAQPIAAA
jgi:hypothetical protein